MPDRQPDDRIALTFAAIAASAEKNRLYAALAKKQGDLQRARLLDAVARAEKFQANRLLMTLRGNIGNADAYYSDLIKQKQDTATAAAPRIQASLEAAGNTHGAEFFEKLTRVSENHRRLLAENAAIRAGRNTAFYVCRVCGFIAEDKAPEKCPVCNAVPEKFTAIMP